MRVAIYTRISTDEDHQPYSLESQETKLKAYIESQDDWELVRSFTDQSSGAKLERPGLRQALVEAKAGRFDLLLVYRVDRFSRSVRGLAQLLEELSAAGVAFRSSTEPFDTTTAAGRMMVQMLGVFAEFERATIIDRVISGMERKAARGEWTAGSKPYGYDVDRKTHQLVVKESEAPLVPLIFNHYVKKNQGAHAIAMMLTERGHRTRSGRPWGNKAVLTILRNRAYIGEIFFRGQYHRADHVALVEQKLFDRAQMLLQQRGEDHAKRAGQASDYLLTGLIVCGRCRKHFVGTAATGNRYRYQYYTCLSKGRYGKGVCDADRLPAEELNKALLKSLIETFKRTSLFDDATRAAHEQQSAVRESHASELSTITVELKSTEDAIERYLLAFERGTLDDQTFAERVKSLGARAGEPRDRREELQNLAKIAEAATPTPQILESVRQNIAKIIESGDPADQKRLVQALVAEIRVKSRSDITPVFRVPLDDTSHDDTKVRDLGNLVVKAGGYSNRDGMQPKGEIPAKRR